MIYKPYGRCLTKRNPDKTQQQKKKKMLRRHLPKVTASSTSRAPLERVVWEFKSHVPKWKPLPLAKASPVHKCPLSFSHCNPSSGHIWKLFRKDEVSRICYQLEETREYYFLICDSNVPLKSKVTEIITLTPEYFYYAPGKKTTWVCPLLPDVPQGWMYQ